MRCLSVSSLPHYSSPVLTIQDCRGTPDQAFTYVSGHLVPFGHLKGVFEYKRVSDVDFVEASEKILPVGEGMFSYRDGLIRDNHHQGNCLSPKAMLPWSMLHVLPCQMAMRWRQLPTDFVLREVRTPWLLCLTARPLKNTVVLSTCRGDLDQLWRYVYTSGHLEVEDGTRWLCVTAGRQPESPLALQQCRVDDVKQRFNVLSGTSITYRDAPDAVVMPAEEKEGAALFLQKPWKRYPFAMVDPLPVL